MSWSYSGDPSNSELDEVRFLIGDTDTADQQLSNEEIEYLLTEHASPLAAAITACDRLQAKYARFANQRTGDISVSYSQISNHYKALSKTLKRRSAQSGLPYAGGIRTSDREIDEEDSDMVQSSFGVGRMDNEGTGYDPDDWRYGR